MISRPPRWGGFSDGRPLKGLLFLAIGAAGALLMVGGPRLLPLAWAAGPPERGRNEGQLIRNPTALLSALQAAKGGETFKLAPGLYSDLVIKNLSFPRPVTLTSADPARPAVLANLIVVRSRGLRLVDLELLAGRAAPKAFAIQFLSSDDIQMKRVSVHGSLDGDATNDPGGVLFNTASGISVTDSEFQQLRQAVGVLNATDVTITDNHAHHLMKTGFVFGGASDVRVLRNTIACIKPTGGEHPDAIQFFTTNTVTSASRITISDNVVLRGDGEFTQGIFMRDQVGTLRYEDVLIARNLVIGTGYGGIYVAGVNGLRIEDNELISIPGKINATWVRVELADDVRVTNNRAINISYANVSRLVEKGNNLNKVVDDFGRAALTRWIDRYPETPPPARRYLGPGAEPARTGPAA